MNMLGITKRIGEALTAHFAGLDEGVYISTRFGNVLGSKGSVIPTFQRQIENGDPITVTDPDVTRYFMTIEEAVQLVVQAGAIGGDGDVHVFDMGEPVPIVQLARRIAAVVKPGVEPEIVYTGLRPGEKLHEVLSGDSEPVIDQPHPLLHRFVVPRLDPMVLSLLQLQELRDHEAFEAVLGEWLNQAQYPPSTSGQAAG